MFETISDLLKQISILFPMKVTKLFKAIVPYGFVALLRLAPKFAETHRLKVGARSQMCALPACEKTAGRFVVTLTSYGTRLTRTLPYTLHTLFCQTQPPDKIVLWLARGTKIPASLKRIVPYGLEIRFCDDLKSYKKLIPSLLEFPEDICITADDDRFYPRDWFQTLKDAYLCDPSQIYCHVAHEVCLDGRKNLIPYEQWRQWIRTIENPARLFPVGFGGILYPPHSLDSRCVIAEEFTRLAPHADDAWFWAMAKLKGTKHALVSLGEGREFVDVDPLDRVGLAGTVNSNGGNDRQLQAILTRFPEIRAAL